MSSFVFGDIVSVSAIGQEIELQVKSNLMQAISQRRADDTPDDSRWRHILMKLHMSAGILALVSLIIPSEISLHFFAAEPFSRISVTRFNWHGVCFAQFTVNGQSSGSVAKVMTALRPPVSSQFLSFVLPDIILQNIFLVLAKSLLLLSSKNASRANALPMLTGGVAGIADYILLQYQALSHYSNAAPIAGRMIASATTLPFYRVFPVGVVVAVAAGFIAVLASGRNPV